MCIRQLGRTVSVITAAVGGVIAAAVYYYVSGADLSIFLWIGLGLAALLLVTLLILGVTQSGGALVRYLREAGSFLLICLIGTIFTSAIGLALLPALDPTELPSLLLLFLSGFFFAGMLISLLFYFLDDGEGPEPPVCVRNTIACR